MTICIKNINILDSKDLSDKPVDILISGDKISAISNFYNKKYDQIIEGRGLYVCPAFIDIYNKLDYNLIIFSDEGKKFLKQGVSDVFVGQGGFSLAPISNSLSILRHYNFKSKINFHWKSTDQFLSFLNKKKLWVNLGTFVGFNNLYNIVNPQNKKNLTNKEFKIILKLLYDALNEGVFGLSINWQDIDDRRISFNQLEEILEILKKHSAIFSVSLSNFLNTSSIVNQILEIVSKKEVKTLIGGYLNHSLTPEENMLILRKISNFYPDVFLTISPYKISPFYFYDFLPSWEKTKKIEDILKDINDSWMRKKILEELPHIDPEKIFFVFTNYEFNNLNGKSLKEIMEIYEDKDWRNCFLNLMSSTKLQGIIFYNGINQDVLIDTLLSFSSLVVSDVFPFYKENVFLDFLNIVLENNLMDIKKAISKINYEPINFLGFKNKKIEIGGLANLVGFLIKDNKIQLKFVLINGKLCFVDGNFGHPTGKLIKHIL